MDAISSKNWQTELLRSTVFVPDSVNLLNMKFWEELMGSPPEEAHSRPRQQSFREQGPFLQGLLIVEANRNRIDWKLQRHPNKEYDNLMPTLGLYDALGNEFHQLMARWLPLCPSTNRLAFGAVLLLPADTVPEACNMLSTFLPAVKIDCENTTDFLYRINRRRNSNCDIQALEINRVSTWSIANVSGINIELGLGNQPLQKIVKLTDDTICRLELDINTAPEFDNEIPAAIVPAIFDELGKLGNEIASQGDIP